jgi:hypothetical protein
VSHAAACFHQQQLMQASMSVRLEFPVVEH